MTGSMKEQLIDNGKRVIAKKITSVVLNILVAEWKNLSECILCSALRIHTAVKLGFSQSSMLRCNALGKLQAMNLPSHNYSGKKESSKQGMNSQKYD